MIGYRRITTQDPEYELEKQLRNRVLRAPLGLTLSGQDLRDEDAQDHLVAMDGEGRVIGCALIVFAGNTARIRQMAVDEQHRGLGIGTELVRAAENVIRAHNVRTVTLHARVSARGFYERLGYVASSGIFTEVTVPHVKMEKLL